MGEADFSPIPLWHFAWSRVFLCEGFYLARTSLFGLCLIGQGFASGTFRSSMSVGVADLFLSKSWM